MSVRRVQAMSCQLLSTIVHCFFVDFAKTHFFHSSSKYLPNTKYKTPNTKNSATTLLYEHFFSLIRYNRFILEVNGFGLLNKSFLDYQKLTFATL